MDEYKNTKYKIQNTISQWAAGTFTKIHLMTFARPESTADKTLAISPTKKKKVLQNDQGQKVSLICSKAQCHRARDTYQPETDVCREHQN